MESPEKGQAQMQTLMIPDGAQLAILVVLTADQQVTVAGTIDSKVAALGLLEVAKGAIIDHVNNAAKGQKIVAPSPGLTHLLGKLGNGRS